MDSGSWVKQLPSGCGLKRKTASPDLLESLLVSNMTLLVTPHERECPVTDVWADAK
jgi:hypothetical protein